MVLFLTAPFMVLEFAAGIITNSLALIADASHMLTDVFGVGMALAAISFASRPATAAKTFGYHRLEILAALANGLLLVGVGVYILWEAYHRFTDPPEILGWPMLGVAAAGLTINIICAWLLLEGQKTSLNMRGAFLEVLSDLLGSIGVIIAGVIILTTGFTLADPIVSVAIGVMILPRTWKLMGEAIHVLLEGSPRDVSVAHVRDHILGVENVIGVHDLHIWSMTSGVPVMTAHVVIEAEADAGEVLDELCGCLAEHFDIEHSTFQIEHVDRRDREHASH